MRRARFLEERSPAWDELDALLLRAKGRPERLGPDGVRRVGALYRAAAADLGLARRTFPGDPVTARLHALVVRGRQSVYADDMRRQSPWAFLATGYWQRIRERPGLLITAAALLLVPAVLSWIWGLHDPAAAIGVVPGQLRSSGDSVAGSLSLGDEAGFAGTIFTNNIRVTFAAVAGGMLLGLGSAALAIYNGVLLGALGGIAQHDGQAERFVALVSAHGILELSCIAVATMAGLRIGWAIVDPGRMTRMESLRAEARPAVELVLGTMPWLVLAGLVEGFFTGSGPTVVPSLVVGFALGAVFWALVAWRGGVVARLRGPDPGDAPPRSPGGARARAQSRARAFSRR